ncbi:MAG: serine hydrolase, partial [Sphaerospermopsis kisseleviana]
AAWKNKQFNAIEVFLGQGLPENVEFYSKMGWNSKTRNDAAIIISPDGKCKYILVVFGDDPSFFQDKTLFSEISRLVYEKMLNSPNTISELNP